MNQKTIDHKAPGRNCPKRNDLKRHTQPAATFMCEFTRTRALFLLLLLGSFCPVHAAYLAGGAIAGGGPICGGQSDGSRGAIAIGGDDSFNPTCVSSDDAIAIGVSAVASGNASVAIGKGSDAARDLNNPPPQEEAPVAIGFQAAAYAANAVAIGSESRAGEDNVVSFGHQREDRADFQEDKLRRLINVADGRDDHNVATVGQLNRAIESGSVHFFSVGHNGQYAPNEGNYNNDGARDPYAIAIGINAQAAEYGTSVGFQTNASESAIAVGHGASATAPRAIALGRGTLARDDFSVALGSESATAPPVWTQNIEIAGKEYAFAGGNPDATVSIGAYKHEIYSDLDNPNLTDQERITRTLTNLAAGRVSAESTDGVNGSQLFATNQALEGMIEEVHALQSPSVSLSGGNGSDMRFFSVRGPNSGDITGVGNYNNDGAEATDSIAIGANTVARGTRSIAIGGETNFMEEDGKLAAGDPAEGALSAIAIGGDTWQKNATALGSGAIAKHEGSVALGYDSTTERAVATEGIEIAGNHYDFAGGTPFATVSIGANHSERTPVKRTLTNLAAGRISAESTDGVNGSQLFAFKQALEDLTDQIDGSSSGGGSVVPVTGSGIGNRNDSVWTLYADEFPGHPANIGDNGKITLAGVGGNISVLLSGDNNDARMNIALNRNLDVDSVTVGNSQLRSDGLRITGGPSVTDNGIDAGGAKVTGVADGSLSSDSTDAVNGSQLFAVISQGIAGGSLPMVQYSNPDTPTTPNGGKQTNDVTLVGGDSTRAVTIHNVAAGKDATDAVNLAQMNAIGNRLNDKIDKLDKRASRGIASSMASAGLAQAYLPGKSMVAAATANYRGQQALAIGASTISDNGKWVIKGTVNANRKDAGVSLGLGYQW